MVVVLPAGVIVAVAATVASVIVDVVLTCSHRRSRACRGRRARSGRRARGGRRPFNWGYS